MSLVGDSLAGFEEVSHHVLSRPLERTGRTAWWPNSTPPRNMEVLGPKACKELDALTNSYLQWTKQMFPILQSLLPFHTQCVFELFLISIGLPSTVFRFLFDFFISLLQRGSNTYNRNTAHQTNRNKRT